MSFTKTRESILRPKQTDSETPNGAGLIVPLGSALVSLRQMRPLLFLLHPHLLQRNPVLHMAKSMEF